MFPGEERDVLERPASRFMGRDDLLFGQLVFCSPEGLWNGYFTYSRPEIRTSTTSSPSIPEKSSGLQV